VKPPIVPISDFKAKCLQLLEEVATKGHSLIVTKRGEPIVRVEPFKQPTKPIRGSWQGVVEGSDDIVYIDLSDEWEASR